MHQILDIFPVWSHTYLKWVVGEEVPEGRVDELFHVADILRRYASELDTVIAECDITTRECLMASLSPSIKEFKDFIASFSENDPRLIPTLRKALEAEAKQYSDLGIQIEYTRLMIVLTLVMLIVMLIRLIVMAWGSWGTSLALIPSYCRIAQIQVKQLLLMLLRNILAASGTMTGMDVGIQGYQKLFGRRDQWDWKATVSMMEGGVWAGLAFTGMSAGLSKLAGSRLHAGLARDDMTLLEKAAAHMDKSMYGAAYKSSLAGMSAASAMMVRQGGPFDFNQVLLEGTSGLVDGGTDGQILRTTSEYAPPGHRPDRQERILGAYNQHVIEPVHDKVHHALDFLRRSFPERSSDVIHTATAEGTPPVSSHPPGHAQPGLTHPPTVDTSPPGLASPSAGSHAASSAPHHRSAPIQAPGDTTPASPAGPSPERTPPQIPAKPPMEAPRGQLPSRLEQVSAPGSAPGPDAAAAQVAAPHVQPASPTSASTPATSPGAPTAPITPPAVDGEAGSRLAAYLNHDPADGEPFGVPGVETKPPARQSDGLAASGPHAGGTADVETSLQPLHAGLSGAFPNVRQEASGSFGRFWRNLTDLVRAEAQRRGTTAEDELQQFTLQRTLARVFAACPDDWMLKGGQAMLARYPGGRASSDIDLVRISGDTDPAMMVADYTAALERDLGDNLRFVLESRQEILHGTAARIAHIVFCGDRELMRLSADLAPPRTRPVWEAPEVIPFPNQILRTGHADENPRLRVISLHDTLAHKVSGMFTHGIRTLETKCLECIPKGGGLFSCKSGDLPSRSQDLADVLFLALNTRWNGPVVHGMLHEEFAWRLTQGENLKVPLRFEIPNPQWTQGFGQYARTMPGLPYADLREAVPLARAFLDPLLSPEPPQGDWDPDRRQWVQPAETTPTRGQTDPPAHPSTAPGIRRIEATGNAPASGIQTDHEMIELWDALSARLGDPASLDANLARLKARTDLSLTDKIESVRQLMAAGAYNPTKIESLNDKHLRFYANQSGEMYSHATALMVDPQTTVEIAFMPERYFAVLRWEARQTHVAYLGLAPDGMTAEQANAVAMWRTVHGKPIHGIDPKALVDDLIDLHAQPLRDALTMRQRLIDDYGIAPGRVRLARDDESQRTHLTETRWVRAHLFALSAIRANPVEARHAIVAAMRGPHEVAEIRESRASAVTERLYAANEPATAGSPDQAGNKSYALVWIRDTRAQPVGGRQGPHLDTRPAFVRQIIQTLRQVTPGRRIVLLGDDIFARRPELRETWEREGLLEDVDTDTLVNFWDASRNGGRRLSHGEQGLFLHRLMTERDVVQIGMRSGAMELPIMLGMPTVYLEAREQDGNRGNRWQLYRDAWAYGHKEPSLDGQGKPLFDASARLITTFRSISHPFPPPMTTVQRLLYGPDLVDPANRRSQPVAIYLAPRVVMTADRINRLVLNGELDQWPRRLGRSAPFYADEWRAWDEEDWPRSQYYTGQLHRWLDTQAATPEAAAHKWQAIGLALTGVLDPNFTLDQEYDGLSIVHPYAMFHSETALPDEVTARIAHAYAAHPQERGAAVTAVLKGLLDSPGFRRGAIHDSLLFALTPAEVHDLRDAIARATDHDVQHPITSNDALSGNDTGGPGDNPAPRRYAEFLDVPINNGDPTPRHVLERFDPSAAGLPEISAAEASPYIALNADQRPWLAPAMNLDPAVQRVLAAMDLGNGHHLERHEGFASAGRLERRVTHLEDPAQLDPRLRARAVDAYSDQVHRCPDTATAIHDPTAFAVAFARAIQHPDVQIALQTSYDPDRRPDRVSLPIKDLLGPDGHLYCVGYRIQAVGGSLEAAVDSREAWVEANRTPGREPDVPEPTATPMESFEGGTVEFIFVPNGQMNGYEIATMFVDPPPRSPEGQPDE